MCQPAPRTIAKPRVPLLADPRPFVLALCGVFLAVVIVYPLWELFLRSFRLEGVFTLENYRRALTAPANYSALWNSVWVSVVATAGATVLGTLLAFVVVRTDLPAKGPIRLLLLLPYAMPPFIGAMAWVQMLGPVGYLSNLAKAVTGWMFVPWNIYSPGGVVLAMAVHFFPLVFVTVAGALQRMDTSLEEAARTSGASLWQVMRDVTLPLMRPAILAGALLAFIGAISNFGIPALLGMRARFFVLTTRIYYSLSVPDIPLATAMSILLVAAAALALYLQRRLLRGSERYAVIAGKSVQPTILGLGRLRLPLAALVWFIVLIVSIMPLVSMVLTGLLTYRGAALTPENFTLEHFRYVFRLDMARRGLGNSLLLAGLAATVTLVLGTTIAYLNVRGRVRGASHLDLVGTIPYAVPSTVIAIAVILAWSSGPLALYGTLWFLLAAYLVQYMPFSLRTTNATLHQIHGSLEEAARVSGAGSFASFRDIVLPLIRPGLVAGWILVFMPALRELTMSILLWSYGTETIGVVIFNMQDSGYSQIAAALASVVLVLLLLGNAVVRRLTGGQVGF